MYIIMSISKHWHTSVAVILLCGILINSFYTYPQLLNTISDALLSRQDDGIVTLPSNALHRHIPYSPCHFPVTKAPQYSIGSDTLETCITQIKSFAAAAANKWPRELVSKLSNKGQYFKTHIINFVLPTWLCPNEERIGGFTHDGAKWICAPRLFLNNKEQCYIYSFGSDANFEFEDYLNRISQCETHIFDPTPGIQKKIAGITLPENYHFHFEAFGGQINKEIVIKPYGENKIRAKPQRFQTKTLDEFVTQLKTPYIDILKIDVEGSELSEIYNANNDSIWTQHKIGQIFIEVHLNFDDEQTFARMFQFFDFLVSHGFVLFHSEWNVHDLRSYEFAFINLDYQSLSSRGSYIQRLLTDPYTRSHENAAHLSDSASWTKFLDEESRKDWPVHFSLLMPEATYHCHNKILIGDRESFQYFMYLCVDTLTSASTYTGIYDSENSMGKSSVEAFMKNFTSKVTTKRSPKSFETMNLIAESLQQFDIVKVDIPGMLVMLSLNHIDSEALFAYSVAKVIHVEFHVCDHTDYFDLRGRFIKLIELFQYYGYEIYHKEVTFIDNLIQEEAGEQSNVCHVAISWIKR